MGRWGDAWDVIVGKKAAIPSAMAATIFAGVSRNGLPPARGTRELLRAYSASPRLRSVVGAIATQTASAKYSAFRIKRSTPSRKRSMLADLSEARIRSRQHPTLKNKMFNAFIRELAAADELEPLPVHPALDLLRRPNSELTSREIREVTQTHLELAGESLWVLVPNLLNMPAEIWPMPPHWLQRAPSPTSPFFEFLLPSGGMLKVEKERVVWMRVPDPEHPYARGTGIARALASEIDADEAAAQTTVAKFANHGIPDLIINVKGVSEETAKQFKEKWIAEHRGAHRAGGIHVSNSDDVTVRELSTSFVDLDVKNLREFEFDIIRETFGVPPEILGHLENSNRATIEAANLIMALFVVEPRLDRTDDAINARVVPLFDDETIIQHESTIPDDWEFALNAAKARPEAQTVDEWRALQSQPPHPNPKVGRSHMMNFGLQIVDLSGGEMPEGVDPIVPDSDNETPAGDGGDDDDADTKGARGTRPHHHRGDRGRRFRDLNDYAPAPAIIVLNDDQRIEQIVGQIDAGDLINETSHLWREQMIEWIQRELAALDIDYDLNVIQVLTERHLKAFGANRITGLINETTRRAIRETLGDGLTAGDNRLDLMDRVRDVFDDAAEWRVENIARTETLRSSNWAITQGQRLGGVSKRQWLAILDARVREAHKEMAFQIRGINEPFTAPGGQKAMYPGDFGIAELDCACRCTTAIYIEDEKARRAIDHGALLKAFDRNLLRFEKRAKKQFRIGFMKQETKVLKRLEEIFGRAA